ncbi:MAG: histidine phosphatase family protein [Anaerolineae bacterium]
MTHLYLIRHADYIYDVVDGQYPRRDQGLSKEGIRQAELLRDRLSQTREIKPNVFISSTQRGAHETAQIIASAIGLPIILDHDVEEWRSDDGSLSDDEFFSRWQQTPDAQKPYYRWYEGGENRMEFTLRVHQALNRILDHYEGKTILVLSHGAVIQTSFVYFFGFGEASIEQAIPR